MSADPPSYSFEDGIEDEPSPGPAPQFNGTTSPPLETQLVISPIHDDFTFQKGYLGADGEHAALEGEVQIKSAAGDDDWDRVSVALQTVEVTPNGSLELSRTQRELWKRSMASASTDPASTPPSVLPFSLPLMQDAPQCIHTPYSSLEHSLTATLHSSDGQRTLSKTVLAHTRRYASPAELPVIPENRSVDAPARVDAQIPRVAWRAGQAIPVYVTVPPPSPALVLSEGIRLRNIRAELVQIVRIPRSTGPDDTAAAEDRVPTPPPQWDELDDDAQSEETEDDTRSSSSDDSEDDSYPAEKCASGDGDECEPELVQYTSIIAHSGAPCRFHRSRPIRIRLVLHPSTTPFTRSLPHAHDDGAPPDCALGISQSAVLHSVRFRLRVRATFILSGTARTERVARLDFPLVILPPVVPRPEEAEADPTGLEGAYRKKHDRPPTRTVRRADAEVDAGPEPGPSDPPPPFDPSHGGARLPTFLESLGSEPQPSYAESEADAGATDDDIPAGEGTIFGFPAADQYDGLSLPGRESGYLPPDFAELMSMRAGDGDADGDAPPPPPPPMDDPSDPPPAIDVPFATTAPGQEPAGGPPPYLNRQQQEHQDSIEVTTGPPPYVDLVPRH
ncbi:hypothetical protein AURDEDRAFT_151297 [Auricularia subglabra TFB-10046 SS5]|nr:hypothetical protein AURDEDRAFT_151297 [Auricularia subglabra TFB-10046 SS5]